MPKDGRIIVFKGPGILTHGNEGESNPIYDNNKHIL